MNVVCNGPAYGNKLRAWHDGNEPSMWHRDPQQAVQSHSAFDPNNAALTIELENTVQKIREHQTSAAVEADVPIGAASAVAEKRKLIRACAGLRLIQERWTARRVWDM